MAPPDNGKRGEESVAEKGKCTHEKTEYAVVNVGPQLTPEERRAAGEQAEHRLFEIFVKYVPADLTRK